MFFYKISKNNRKPYWVTKSENNYGEIWINMHGGWCLKNEKDEILEVADYPNKDSFIDCHRKEVYSYLINDNSDLGWLSPDGRFYGCAWAAHEMVATEYFGKKDSCELESEGWIKVFDSVDSGTPVYAERRVTEYQRVWLDDHNVKFSYC
jgi:hypothetical protein